MEKKKIYLSGPDRLKKNARELFKEKKGLCERYGFELIEYPDALFEMKDTLENGERIARERLELLKKCDIIIADTRDFRSYVEPYSECAFELGMAYALNKKLYSYMPDARICDERYSGEKHLNENGRLVDKDGISFEPGPLNLMLEYSSKIIEGDLEAALSAIKEDLEKGAF